MESRLDNILGNIKPQRLSKRAIGQFKIVAKYLCFVASAAKVTVGDEVDKKTGEIVEKFGTAKNIMMWCLTPMQLSVLANSDGNGMSRVIFMGPNGSGKSILLKEVGKQKATQDIVVYAIYDYYGGFKTFLYFMIKQELEKHGIEVILINEDR